jgi:hypothetical protein
MALGSTQPLTEMSTRNLPGGKGRAARKADNLTAICEPIVWKMWEPRRLTTPWVSTVCYRDSFTFYTFYTYNENGSQDPWSNSRGDYISSAIVPQSFIEGVVERIVE